jgi:hypothetical protein
MPKLSTIYDYMRLCGAPHNLIYVKMSVMLSCFIKGLSFLSLLRPCGHITCILG